MENPVKFHCSIKSNFDTPEKQVRGFTYYDYSIDAHMHDFYEINIIMGGSGIHHIDNNRISVARGDVFVIPPMVVHSYTDTRELAVYHILVKPAFINEVLRSIPDEGLRIFLKTEPFMRRNHAKALFLKLKAKELLLIKHDLDALSEEYAGQYPVGTAFQNHTFLKLLCWFSDLMQVQQDEAHDLSDHTAEKSIMAVLNYIDRHYVDTISVKDLCRVASMSKATLFRNFKAYCGCSPMEFIRSQRKARALAMLTDGAYSKTRIAQECGFYDLSHMDKSLKTKNGTD